MKRVLLLMVSAFFAVACGSDDTAAENTEVSSGSEYTEDQWGEQQAAGEAEQASEQAEEAADEAGEAAEEATEEAEEATE